jgi:zinc protease
MTAGMLTEGTKTKGAQEIARATEALGATLESGGGQESASVTLNVMPGKLPQAMAIMADVARNPAFADEELERQRAQALDGLSVSLQQPGSLAGFAASQVLYAGTAFGQVPGGTPASLAKLKVGDLSKIHQAYYRPDNAILVLTGDITPEQGFALAQKSFGDWKAPATPTPPQPVVNPKLPPRAVAIDLPGAGQAAVNVEATSIARDDPAFYPATVANTVLGGGYSARLNEEIRIKRGLSYGAGSGLAARRTTGLFRASAQTKNESAPEVLDLINAELKRLAAEPAGADELKARKSTLVGNYGRNLATTDGLADTLGNLALYGVPLSELGAYTQKVEAVTADQVQGFARTELDPARMSVIVAGDAKAFGDELKKRAPNLEVIPAAEIDLDRPDLRKPK